MYRCVILSRNVNGPFTLAESETETDTETDKMATVPNDIGDLVQCEHFHKFLYKPFLVSISVSVMAYLHYRRQTRVQARTRIPFLCKNRE